MLVIPAVDLRGGLCVRLYQGRPDRETVYSQDPVAVAKEWEEKGATWLHVVDLDGAFSGKPQNQEQALRIAREANVPVQVGGGIRDMQAVRTYLDQGVRRVILGTAAAAHPEFLKEAAATYGERIVVGVDCLDGKVCVQGWEEATKQDGLQYLEELVSYGIKRIVFTDIKRDGTLEGPNLEAIRQFAAHTALRVIAAGGVSRLSDIYDLKKLEDVGVDSVIIGQALYTGEFTLQEALDAAKGDA